MTEPLDTSMEGLPEGRLVGRVAFADVIRRAFAKAAEEGDKAAEDGEEKAEGEGEVGRRSARGHRTCCPSVWIKGFAPPSSAAQRTTRRR